MGPRDVRFASMILGGVALLGSSILPPFGRSTPPEPPADGGLRAVVARVDSANRRAWADRKLTPGPRAPDLAILRRMSLALTGTIPSLEEVRRFEAMPPEGRLARRLEELLSDRRSADYLAERLARAFVGTEGGPFLVYRRRRFVSWLADEIGRDRPYDALVRDLIAGRGLWTDHPATNFVTVTFDPAIEAPNPERLAARVARAFLGARIDCAQCHDHPFQPWKQADFRGLAAYFGQVRSGLAGISDRGDEYRVDDRKDGHPTPVEPRLPFLADLDPKLGTRRERLAHWLTDPRNSHLARSTANRAWALLFGRPMVEPVDDLSAAGESPEALQILADDFVGRGFSLRRLIRTIASTEAFAMESASEEGMAGAEYPLVRLRPEQVAGALLQSASVSTIDAGSHLLTRLATYAGVGGFVDRHGDLGEDEFRPEPTGTIPQRLLMMNGDLVRQKTGDDLANAAKRVAMLAPDDRSAVESIYLATLTRRPTLDEAAHFEARLAGTKGRAREERMSDLAWALLNASEFSHGH